MPGDTRGRRRQVTAPPRPYRVIRDRGLLLLLGGQAVSNLGDIVFDTSLTLWIAVQLAPEQPWAPMAVSGVFAAASLPILIVGPLAGVFVDRWVPKATMLVSDALRTGLVLALAATSLLPGFSVAGQIATIYAVVFLASVCSQFFAPARVAAIADLVAEPHRAQAASLSQLLQSLALILGPALAAPLFFQLGVHWALLVNALSFVVSWVAIACLPAGPRRDSGAAAAAASFTREFVDGLRFFARSTVLRTLLLAAVIVMLGAGAFNALAIFFLTENLGASPESFGVVGAVFGTGMLSGAIVASIAAPRLALWRLFALATITVGALILVLARLHSLPPALVIIFCLGAVLPALQVALGPLLLEATPREYIGRVVSVMSSLTSAADMSSVVLAGLLASTLLRGMHVTVGPVTFGPYDTIFTATGLLAVLGGGYAAVLLGREARRRGSKPAPTT